MDEEVISVVIGFVLIALIGSYAGFRCNKDDDTVLRDCVARHTPAECRTLNH